MYICAFKYQMYALKDCKHQEAIPGQQQSMSNIINYKTMANFEHSKKINFKTDIEYAANSIVSKRVLEKPTGNISLFAFDKEQQLSEHTAPFDAMIQVVEGLATIIIAGENFSIKEGETIIMPANIPHAVFAKEKFKMLLTMIKA